MVLIIVLVIIFFSLMEPYSLRMKRIFALAISILCLTQIYLLFGNPYQYSKIYMSCQHLLKSNICKNVSQSCIDLSQVCQMCSNGLYDTYDRTKPSWDYLMLGGIGCILIPLSVVI